MFEGLIILAAVVGFFWIVGSYQPSGPKTGNSCPNAGPATRRATDKVAHQPGSRPFRLQGKCFVIDGDTVIIKGTKIRLAGVDAPELDEPFGQKAKWAMVRICKGQVVNVDLNGETSHDRLVGTCYLPDGRDIGAELIKQGLAVDWSLFSGGKYRSFEPAGVRHRLRRYPHYR